MTNFDVGTTHPLVAVLFILGLYDLASSLVVLSGECCL